MWSKRNSTGVAIMIVSIAKCVFVPNLPKPVNYNTNVLHIISGHPALLYFYNLQE